MAITCNAVAGSKTHRAVPRPDRPGDCRRARLVRRGRQGDHRCKRRGLHLVVRRTADDTIGAAGAVVVDRLIRTARTLCSQTRTSFRSRRGCEDDQRRSPSSVGRVRSSAARFVRIRPGTSARISLAFKLVFTLSIRWMNTSRCRWASIGSQMVTWVSDSCAMYFRNIRGEH